MLQMHSFILVVVVCLLCLLHYYNCIAYFIPMCLCHDHDECHCHILFIASCSSFIILHCAISFCCICASCHYAFSMLIICLVVFILLCLHHVRYYCSPMHVSHALS